MAQNPTRTASNPRIAKLIELEVSGRIKPEHQQELDTYRAQGLAPKKATGDKATEANQKGSGFYARALSADRDFQQQPSEAQAARGMVGDAAAATLPAGIVNSNTSPERQNANQAKENFIAATLRLESGAVIGDDEFNRQDRIFFPQTGDNQQVIEQKSRARKVAIDGLRLSAGPLASDADKVAAGAAPTPLQSSGAMAGPSAEQRAVSPDGSTRGPTDADRQFAAIAQDAFDKGAGRADLDALSVRYGYGRYGADLDKAIAYREKGGKGATILAPEGGSSGPTVLGTLAASAPGAAITGVANAVTGGTLDEIVGLTGGDQAKAQAAKEAMRASHPLASMAGEIGGGVLASLGAGRVASAALPAIGGTGALSVPALAADAGYGAIYGAGENNDSRLTGGVLGALTSAAGGAAGRSVLSRAAGVVAPNVDPDVAFLRNRGVRLTPGQAIGPTASRAEEKLVSVPGPGDLIRSGRQTALDDFNRGYLNDALSRIEPVVGARARLPDGALGTQAMAHGQQAFDDAYDIARSGMSLAPDAQMATDLADLSTHVANGGLAEPSAKRLGSIYENEVMPRLPVNGAPMDGNTYKKMISKLGKLQTSSMKTDPELADAIGEMASHLENAARRSSAPEAVAAMDAADEGYALWVRGENAAAMRGGDTGSFTPAQLDSAVQRGDRSVRSRGYLRGDALGQDWANAGKAILRDQVPNSGTTDRAVAAALAGGVGWGTGIAGIKAAAIPLGVLSLAEAPGVRNVLSGLIARDAGPTATSAAAALRRNAYVGGAVGSPLALDWRR